MKLKNLIICFLFSVCFLLFSCTIEKEIKIEKLSEQTIISAHTSGEVSRKSHIRIIFAHDIVVSTDINSIVENSLLKFQPNISGKAIWIDKRTLEFKPDNNLPSGEKYKATVNLKNIAQVSKDAIEGAPDKFTFTFEVMKQAFEITMDGLLAVNTKDLKKQILKGSIVTADIEESLNLEKSIYAEQSGKNLSIRWLHSDNKRGHSFIIEGILRQDESSQVFMYWDGKSLGVNKKGRRIIDVPALDIFKIIDATAIEGREQHILLRFSAPLMSDQMLKGLIG